MSKPIEESTAPLKLTKTEQKFKKVVETAMAKLPRFIFRKYHSRSGGHSDLNTTAAITPLAFSARNRDQKPPSSFYKFKPDKIASIAQMHLVGRTDQPTVFSSWSQSLGFVIDLYGGYPEAYVSILDTTLMDSSVVVLHTNQMAAVLGHPVRPLSHELLAYGVVSGRAYQAISMGDINRALGPGRSIYRLGAHGHPDSLYRVVADLYNDDFKLAMAAHCLAMSRDDPEGDEADQRLVQQFLELPVPAGWKHDRKVMNLEETILSHYAGPLFEEAREATEFMRDLVRLSVAAGGHTEFMRDLMSLAMAARLPREILDLRIEANGWKWPPTRLRGGRSRGDRRQT